jgi:hypothetical protein
MEDRETGMDRRKPAEGDRSLRIRCDMRDEDRMRDDYSFSGAVRGKYYRAYRAGHAVRIHKANGAVEVHLFTQEDGAVMLDPDVKTRFPTSAAVSRSPHRRSSLSLSLCGVSFGGGICHVDG